MGEFNLSVDKMNSVVDISKIVFVSNSRSLPPNSRIFVTVESLCSERGFSLHNDDLGSEGGTGF